MMNVTLTDGRVVTYEQFVATLFKQLPTLQDELNHAAMGIAGESGEFVDAIKRHTIYGKELDITNVMEELGDLAFYMQAVLNKIGASWEEIVNRNVAKLEVRYPAGTYSDEAAIAREDKQVDGTADMMAAMAPEPTITNRVYYNQYGAEYFSDTLDEARMESGAAGDYMAYRMSDGRLMKCAIWSEDHAVWMPCAVEQL